VLRWCPNHQSCHVDAKYKSFGLTCRLASSPEAGPGATVGTLKLGYPLLLYKDAVPMRLSLSHVVKVLCVGPGHGSPQSPRLLWVHSSARLHHMGGSGAATCPEKVIYSKASTVSPDPMGEHRTPGYTVRTSKVGLGPPCVQARPLEWDPGRPQWGPKVPG
jgi:hypothetical protein